MTCLPFTCMQKVWVFFLVEEGGAALLTGGLLVQPAGVLRRLLSAATVTKSKSALTLSFFGRWSLQVRLFFLFSFLHIFFLSLYPADGSDTLAGALSASMCVIGRLCCELHFRRGSGCRCGLTGLFPLPVSFFPSSLW